LGGVGLVQQQGAALEAVAHMPKLGQGGFENQRFADGETGGSLAELAAGRVGHRHDPVTGEAVGHREPGCGLAVRAGARVPQPERAGEEVSPGAFFAAAAAEVAFVMERPLFGVLRQQQGQAQGG